MDDTTTHTEQPVTSDSAGSESEPLFRRDVLSVAATGAAALTVAPSAAGASQTTEDRWFETGQVEHPVDTFQYNTNMWAGTTHAQFGLFAQYAHYDWEHGEFVPHLVEDWTVGETEMTLSLREDVSWETGDPVDAESLLVQWDAYERSGHELFDVADGVEATDDYELTIRYPRDTNRGIVEHAVLHEAADMAPADWAEFDGDSLQNHDVPEPTASGPLVLTERDDDYHQFEPRDRVPDVADHPYAENYNWNGYRMQYFQDNQAVHQSFVDQELDGIHSLFVDGSTLVRFPDTVEEITFPGTYGLGLWFNHDREPWSDRRVRQALAHSLDLEPALQSLGDDAKIYHETQTGLAAAAVDEWLESWTPDGFVQYGDEDPADLVDDAGHDLSEVDAEIVVPAGWSDWVLLTAQIADELDLEGWNADLRTLGGSYWSARANGDYDVLAMEHSDGPRHNHPYFSLRFKLYGNDGTPPDLASYAGGDDAVTVDGETIHLQDTVEELATTSDRSDQEALVRDLALVVNRDLPYVHVTQKYEQSFVDREFWAFPEEHELLRTQWPLWALAKTDESLDDYVDGADPNSPGLLKARADGPTRDEPGSDDPANSEPGDEPPWDEPGSGDPPGEEPGDDPWNAEPGGGTGPGDDASGGGGLATILRALLRLFG